MSIQISPSDLYALGLQIDPDNPSQAIHVAQQAESIPDESWNLDRLGIYAENGLSEASRLQRESIQLGRRSAVQIFRAGHALSIARRKVPWGEWGPWLATRNIKRTTAWEAIELYQRAGSEEAIAKLRARKLIIVTNEEHCVILSAWALQKNSSRNTAYCFRI
jgi:hypothetical protein